VKIYVVLGALCLLALFLIFLGIKMMSCTDDQLLVLKYMIFCDGFGFQDC
jgi:hypothetical protein